MQLVCATISSLAGPSCSHLENYSDVEHHSSSFSSTVSSFFGFASTSFSALPSLSSSASASDVWLPFSPSSVRPNAVAAATVAEGGGVDGNFHNDPSSRPTSPGAEVIMSDHGFREPPPMPPGESFTNSGFGNSYEVLGDAGACDAVVEILKTHSCLAREEVVMYAVLAIDSLATNPINR